MSGFFPFWKAAWTGVLLIVLLGGCQTVEQRIEENAAVFETFDPEVQEKIRAEEVGLGFTPTMVEIAWGEPDYKEVRRAEEGEVETWVYVDYESYYAGSRFAGYYPEVYYDSGTEIRRTYLEPYYVDLYETVEVERDRVQFRDGKVISVTRAES